MNSTGGEWSVQHNYCSTKRVLQGRGTKADRIPQTFRTTNLPHAGTGSDSLLALDAFVQPLFTLQTILLLFILFNLAQLRIQILDEARR